MPLHYVAFVRFLAAYIYLYFLISLSRASGTVRTGSTIFYTEMYFVSLAKKEITGVRSGNYTAVIAGCACAAATVETRRRIGIFEAVCLSHCLARNVPRKMCARLCGCRFADSCKRSCERRRRCEMRI